MNTIKKISVEWIYPALWGILIYNVLRAVTDLTRPGIFWEGDIRLHLVALLFSVLICYAGNIIWRRRLLDKDFSKGISGEYICVFGELIISLNILLIAGQSSDVLFMGAGWIDYMLINATYLPLLLIFYTLIRSSIISKNVHEKVISLEKLKAEKNKAELDFLKSQYHPHFLFNALNTIYFQVDENNQEAKRSIEHLSELLRYQLYDVNQTVTFYKEIQYLRSYIAFQQLRKTDKLIVNIEIDSVLKEQKVHPLLLQPLLENAFKYVAGSYRIDLSLKLLGDEVAFILKNSVSSVSVSESVKDSGIGLSNLKRKLELLYPDKHKLTMENSHDYFEITLKLQIM
ncbi:sensor histidine kinase [Flavobacterium notoginsengisoli]|uniref:sensor histidine kinase n=1 Tax=Flavobacterium notoginsengisoli TaxID=1478199 RepID=UPI003644F799